VLCHGSEQVRRQVGDGACLRDVGLHNESKEGGHGEAACTTSKKGTDRGPHTP